MCPLTGDVGGEGEAEGAGELTRGNPWGQQAQGQRQPGLRQREQGLSCREGSQEERATHSLEQLCLGRKVGSSSEAATFSVIPAHSSCIPGGTPAGLPRLASVPPSPPPPPLDHERFQPPCAEPCRSPLPYDLSSSAHWHLLCFCFLVRFPLKKGSLWFFF